MTKATIQKLAAAGLGLLATANLARAQDPAPGAPAAPAQDRPQVEIERRPGDLPGPVDSFHDVQDSLKMAFMAADQNHDGLISQREATDSANMVVGGFFFVADANGDGTISRDEARQARDRVLQNNPMLRFVLQRAKDTNQDNQAGTEAVRGLANLIDSDNDQQVKAAEVRQAVQTAVQGVFAVSDTNRDNQLSPTEMNAAVLGLAKAAAQASFQAADADKSGSLSKDEFAKSLVEPANVVFDILDADLDGQLTAQEMERAGRVIATQVQAFQIPEASNSPQNLLESGRRPGEAAPVPDVRIPAGNRNRPNAPAAPGRPAAPAQPGPGE